MRLSQAGAMVQTTWEEIPTYYPGVQVDAFVVMPNHVHGIVVLSPTPTGVSRVVAFHHDPALTDTFGLPDLLADGPR